VQGRIFVYASVLVTLTLCSLFQFACTARTDDNEKQKSSSVMKTFLAGEDPTKVRQVSPSGNCPTCPVIKSVTLIPEQPTILDNIKAVLSLDREAPPNTKFE
jgi:hypothetical protein